MIAADDEGLVTLAQVLEWLPRDIAADFNCTRGPHTWRDVGTAVMTYDFCLHCRATRRRLNPWADTGELLRRVARVAG